MRFLLLSFFIFSCTEKKPEVKNNGKLDANSENVEVFSISNGDFKCFSFHIKQKDRDGQAIHFACNQKN
jgi:hypothetical protein